MRNKVLSYEVQNALTIGTDSEGGYLVPDEYEKKLVEALEEGSILPATLPSSRLQAVTVRSQSLHPRVRQHGSMRAVSSRNLMTASDRQPSVPLSWQP